MTLTSKDIIAFFSVSKQMGQDDPWWRAPRGLWQKQMAPKESNKRTVISPSPGMKKQHFASNGPYGLTMCMPKSVETYSKLCMQAASMAACGVKVALQLWDLKKNCRFFIGKSWLEKTVWAIRKIMQSRPIPGNYSHSHAYTHTTDC